MPRLLKAPGLPWVIDTLHLKLVRQAITKTLSSAAVAVLSLRPEDAKKVFQRLLNPILLDAESSTEMIVQPLYQDVALYPELCSYPGKPCAERPCVHPYLLVAEVNFDALHTCV